MKRSLPNVSDAPAGSALILVLCFVVLLTAVILAILSRSLSNGLIANSSVNVNKADLYGHGAIEQVIGDLEQEIAAGSTTMSVTGGTLYRPKEVGATAYASAVPYNSGPVSYSTTTWNQTFPNLVKESANGVAFYPNNSTYDANGPTRAAAVSTDSASGTGESGFISSTSADGQSRNGRYISAARWNKPLLLPKASASFNGGQFTAGANGTALSVADTGTLTTPVAAFRAPDWILTAADGTNPTTLDTSSANNNINAKSSKFVVGRYAYMIYNEGGLLNANVAGTPAATTGSGWTAPLTTTFPIVKGQAAYADLTQLPGLASLAGSFRAQHAVDTLVGWRNYATAQPTFTTFPTYTFRNASGLAYFQSLLGLPTSFMTAQNTATFNGLSDRVFTGRQQLISFFQNIVATTGANHAAEQALLQDALMYLGTSSRTLNQPSYWPDPARPTVVGAPGTLATYTGGNSASGADSTYNPPFRSVRVSGGPWTRYDGTTANNGDPLVKKRFALMRLIWLTYKGPSASLSATDALYQQYLLSYTGSTTGTAPAWLTQLWSEGTAANIRNYFGLTWTAGSGSGGIGGYWTYASADQTVGANNNNIELLGSITGREPNFFELLKAAICAGSLAKAEAFTDNSLSANGFQNDTSVDLNIFTIGANMVDQFDPDSFPTQIVTSSLGHNSSVWGKEDLPYLWSMEPTSVVSDPGNPVDATTIPNGSATGSLTSPGSGVFFITPSIWAPYISNTVAAGLAPTSLRMGLTSLEPAAGAASTTTFSVNGIISTAVPTTQMQISAVAPAWNSLGATWNSTEGTITLPAETSPNNSLLFNNVSTLYRDPTPLITPSIPSGSGLSIDAQNQIVVTEGGTTAGIKEQTTTTFYVGFPVLKYTPRFTVAGKTGIYTALDYSEAVGGALTVSLEYQSGSAWIPYEQDSSMTGFDLTPKQLLWNPGLGSGFTTVSYYWPNGISTNINKSSMNPVYDPRSSRFGRPFDTWVTPWLKSGATYLTGTTLLPPQPGQAVTSHVGYVATSLFYNSSGAGSYYIGSTPQNNYAASGSYFYYADADGVVRRGPAGAVTSFTPTSTTGLPTTPMTGTGITSSPAPLLPPGVTSMNADAINRPIMLNRPFRSVAELGCVFRDQPWKNIDFSNPESGDSALLDVFCIQEDYRTDAVADGRVDLNSKQAPVFQALLASAYRDEISSSTSATGGPYAQASVVSTQATLSQQEAVNVSLALVNRTTVSPPATSPAARTSAQPLANIADLVGRWVPGYAATVPINGAAAYDGFSGDLAIGTQASGNYAGLYLDPASAPSAMTGKSYLISRFRESTMRALSDSCQAGTWDLLIDVIAQSGRYPANAAALSDFLVEGEHRYWVHVAIDRQTGQVVDENIEPVNE